jgi:hypothetical protein
LTKRAGPAKNSGVAKCSSRVIVRILVPPTFIGVSVLVHIER